MSERDWIVYPYQHVFGIVDEDAAADAAVKGILDAGVPEEDITVLTGESGAARIDSHGSTHGMLGRVVRALQFAMMDALPDSERYERAALDGKYVLAIRTRDDQTRDMVHQELLKHGGHFLNYYGKLTTQPLSEP